MALGQLAEAVRRTPDVLGLVEVLAGEEHDLAVEPDPADVGDGLIVGVAEVDTADLGADGARERRSPRVRRCR